MLRSLKERLRRSKRALIAYKIFDNLRFKWRLRSGDSRSLHGSTHSLILKGVLESVEYINLQVEDYLRYSGLSSERLANKRVLELGYGDNVGVALRFLASGGEQVVCLDKFNSQRDVEHELRIYRALRETLSSEERSRFDEAISLDDGIQMNPYRLRCISGIQLETAIESLTELSKSFDLIVSRAVLEEIYNPDSLFTAADKVLASGGHMLHKIDLRDYGIFSEGGMHPLTFLTIPNFVYRLMASDSGIPNRKLIAYYRDKVKALGYDAKVFITSIIGSGPLAEPRENVRLGVDYSESTQNLVEGIRSSLARDFRRMPVDELIVDGIFLVARKP
ncbi:MAG: methyltransferase domain-containing protein [Pyrinomonadaceae bacterium]